MFTYAQENRRHVKVTCLTTPGCEWYEPYSNNDLFVSGISNITNHVNEFSNLLPQIEFLGEIAVVDHTRTPMTYVPYLLPPSLSAFSRETVKIGHYRFHCNSETTHSVKTTTIDYIIVEFKTSVNSHTEQYSRKNSVVELPWCGKKGVFG